MVTGHAKTTHGGRPLLVVLVCASFAGVGEVAHSGDVGDGAAPGARAATCQVFCNAMAPRSGTAGRPMAFIGAASASACSGAASYSWEFGDGIGSTERDPIHTYTGAGSRGWSFTATVDGESCSQSGALSVSAMPTVAPVYVAAVAHAPGAAGTTWRTDLAIANLAGVTASVTLTFTPYAGGTPISRTVTVASGAILEWRDALVALFGIDQAAAVKGTVRLDADVAVYASARTYNQTLSGTFGQYIPAIAADDCIGVGGEGVVLLLRKSAGFRSNLGFLNVSSVACTTNVELQDHNGVGLGPTQTWSVAAGRYWQQDDVFAAFGAAEEDVAYARVMPQTAGCLLWAYGSVVDNESGDPTTIPVLWGMETTPQSVAALAHAPGAGGTEWRTDLAVGNLSGVPVAATFSFVPYSGGTPIVRSETVWNAGTNVWNDVLVSLFGFPAGEARKGTLEVSGDGPLFVTSRTYNDTPSGTFGQGIPAVAARRCLTGGDVGVIPQLRKSSAFRSNLGILNTGGTDGTVAIELFDQSGTQLGSTLVRTVTAGEYWQQDDIFAGVGASATELAYATVQLLTPEATVWAYGSVVDNATGDPTTVPVIVGGAGATADRSGIYNLTIGPEPTLTLELDQQGSAVDFVLTGKNIEIEGTGSASGDGVELAGNVSGFGEMAMTLTFANHGQTFAGTWEFDSEVPMEGTAAGTRAPWPTRNLDGLGIPPFVERSGINLETIAQVSRFRSGAGHDFSDDFEDCRSMKHYYMPKPGVAFSDVTVHAPFDGTVIGTTEEWEDATTWKGTAVGIRSNDHPEFSMTFFHIDLDPPLEIGDLVASGQTLGTSEKASGTATDFAMWVNTPDGSRLVSYFEAMTDGAFSVFQARGGATRDLFIIPKAERDADPLQCNGEQFVDEGSLVNWVTLN